MHVPLSANISDVSIERLLSYICYILGWKIFYLVRRKLYISIGWIDTWWQMWLDLCIYACWLVYRRQHLDFFVFVSKIDTFIRICKYRERLLHLRSIVHQWQRHLLQVRAGKEIVLKKSNCNKKKQLCSKKEIVLQKTTVLQKRNCVTKKQLYYNKRDF